MAKTESGYTSVPPWPSQDKVFQTIMLIPNVVSNKLLVFPLMEWLFDVYGTED